MGTINQTCKQNLLTWLGKCPEIVEERDLREETETTFDGASLAYMRVIPKKHPLYAVYTDFSYNFLDHWIDGFGVKDFVLSSQGEKVSDVLMMRDHSWNKFVKIVLETVKTYDNVSMLHYNLNSHWEWTRWISKNHPKTLNKSYKSYVNIRDEIILSIINKEDAKKPDDGNLLDAFDREKREWIASIKAHHPAFSVGKPSEKYSELADEGIWKYYAYPPMERARERLEKLETDLYKQREKYSDLLSETLQLEEKTQKKRKEMEELDESIKRARKDVDSALKDCK